MKRAVEMEGTVTGEHGVGLVKRDYLAREVGQTTVDAMRKVNHMLKVRMVWINVWFSQLKQAFDPLCLLNCDKIMRMQKPKSGEVKPW